MKYFNDCFALRDFISRLTVADLQAIRDALTKLIPPDDRPSEKGC